MNTDQIALDIIDNWKIDSLGDGETQTKAKLQIAICYELNKLQKQLEQQAKEIKVLKEKCVRRKENQIALREENKQQAKSIDELVEAIYKIRDTVAIKAFWEISHNDIAEELAIADKFKTNKRDK